jgi:hypothetical protein
VGLIWTVPVVAASAATLVVLARARTLEELSLQLARDIRRLREVRRPVRQLHDTLAEGEPLVDGLWRHWRTHEHSGSP